MGLRHRAVTICKILLCLSVCFALIIAGYFSVQSDSRVLPKQGTQPSSPVPGRLFACLQSWAKTNRHIRVAVLHDADWVLESSILPSCFPEREVVFAFEVGTGLIPHPFTSKTSLWVTRDHDFTHIRIVASSGGEEQDMVAVSFVTNHKCIDRSSKTCSIKGGAVLVRFD